MIKKNIKILKDYFSLVKLNNHLIYFIIFDFLYILADLYVPIIESRIVEDITKNIFDEAFYLIISLIFVYLIYNFFCHMDYRCYANFFKKVYVQVHEKLVNSIYGFDEDYSKKISIGKIINSSNMDIINISELPSFIFETFTCLINLLIIYAVFLYNNLFIGLFVIVINVIYVYFCNYCNKKRAYYFSKQRKYGDKLTGLLSQILIGLKDIKSFNFENKLNNKFDGYRKKWQVNYFQTRRYLFNKISIVNYIINIGRICLYLFLLFMIINQKITLSMFLLLISYYGATETIIKELMDANMSIDEEAVSLYRLKEIISYGEDTLKIDGNNFNNDIIGKVEFKNVSFSYENNKVLNNLSFKIEPNKITSIVGRSGVGKTTIFNLLLRLYKIDKGKIFLNDTNIYDFSKKVYSSNIAIVNQKSFIFNMSIRQNLSLIDSNKKRQENACKRALIHDYIMSLPKGYNTVLKEDATNLSGGQKQLLSLARALLTTSEIILLDEVTSALDPKTTNLIVELLEDLKQDHTIILITHNKEMMKNSDKLLVLKDGKIVVEGTHNDLIKNSEVYQDLYNEEL